MSGGTAGLGGFESDYLSPGYLLAGYMDDTPVDLAARTLAGDAVVVLYIIDATLLGGPVYRFTEMTNELKAPVTWQGEVYTPYPCVGEGFEFDGDGTVPRPKFLFSNKLGYVSAILDLYEGLQNAKVTRKRTEARYLDAVNFALGNPGANPNAGWPDDIFYVERVVRENKIEVEIELATAADLQGAKLPKRVCTNGTCTWAYQGAECGYTGGLPTCDKTLADCKVHFGATEPLPFGGFPGVGRFRR